MPDITTISLDVNGEIRQVEVDPSTPLIFVLRNQLGLTGAKLGCGLEQCGACAVLVDGESALTCSAPVAQFESRKIITVEGLRNHPIGAAVQQAFIEEGAAQCGYCTPGIVTAVTALLIGDRQPTNASIQEALKPHLCRCGSHVRVLAAVRRLTTERGHG